MLVQQETKLAKAEEVDNDIFVLLESRRKEWDNDLKELHSRITTNSRELREHQILSENKMLNELRNIRNQLDNRVAVLEKWRWIIVGGSKWSRFSGSSRLFNYKTAKYRKGFTKN